MGTWGTGTFENDDASDWVFELEKAADFAILGATLDEAIKNRDGVEAGSACNALAAAEVVAALCGRHGNGLPDEVVEWVKKMPPADKALIEKARKAVFASQDVKSELWELWAEADEAEFAEWKNVIANLLGRLK